MSRVSKDDLASIFVIGMLLLLIFAITSGAFFGMDREDHRKRAIDHEIIAACHSTDDPAACVKTMKKALEN